MKKYIIILIFVLLPFMFNSCSGGSNDSPIMEDTFSISITNSTLTFGDLTVNTTATKTFTITNTGNTTINISSISVPTGFSLSATTATITPNNNKIITVTFLPTEVISYSGVIVVTSNSTNSPNNISISGNGIAFLETFTTSLSNTSLNFGDLTVNTTKTEDFTITNTGNQNIEVTNISAPAGFTLSATTATITPANITQITVTFSPTEVKVYNGTITITSNSTSSATSITVSGTGIAVVNFPTYTLNIAPIINVSCITCHGNPTANGAPMSLTTSAQVQEAIQNRGLIDKIETGVMPKVGTPLTAVQVQLFKDWETGGFLD